MGNLIKNIYYRYKTAFLFNYSVDNTLERLLNECLECGLKNVSPKENCHERTVVFNDDTVLVFWDVNKYYAWLSQVDFRFKNGTRHRCTDVRPTAKTMYRFKTAIENFDYRKVQEKQG